MNPNIAMGFQRPRFDPQEGQRNALAMRQAQMQEATQLMQMQQAQQAAQREGARRNALASADWNSPESLTQVRGALGQQGDIDGVMAIDNHIRSLGKDRRDAAIAEIDAIPKLAGGLSDPMTYRQTREMAARVAPEFAAGLPEEFDPQIVDPINRAAMSANDWRAQQNTDRTFEETRRHNKQSEATAAQRAANSGPLALISNTDGSMTAVGGPNGIAPNAMRSIANAKGIIKQGETEGKAVGDFFGKKYADILSSSDSALMDNSKLDRLDSLLTNIETGKFKGTTNEIKKAGKAMGIDLESMGIRDDVAPVEAARSLAGELTLSAVSAAKLTPVSNTDLQYMNSLQPGIETTPDGRKLVIQSRKAINKRNIEVGKMATKYRKQFGALDEGFQEMVTNFAEQNPLFRAVTTDADYSAIPSGEYFMAPDGSVRKKP